MSDNEPPRLQLVEQPVEAPAWLRQALDATFKPLLGTWDARSRDMLDVLAEASRTRYEVRSAARSIKIAGALFVVAMGVAGALVLFALQRERAQRQAFREAEAIRRIDAAQMILRASREQNEALERRLLERCPLPAAR